MRCSIDLEEAILSYNRRYKGKWSFKGLHRYITEEMDSREAEILFQSAIPNMAKLALRLPELVTQGIPLLKKGMNRTLIMSQEQVACLMANAFFCTFPRRNSIPRTAKNSKPEYENFPDINFNRLFAVSDGGSKLRCIFHYFKRVTENRWLQRLCKLHVSQKGTIEDYGLGFLQVDFANKFVGGGVLGYGCVQEEIRFMICPEMIISRLFTEALMKCESLIMKGCERFSYYTGYADSFDWTATCIDETVRDAWGRKETEVVAIDALHFRNRLDQFKPDMIERELNKAYAGFHRYGLKPENLSAVATGNWGCGVFGGDKQLKSLIQLMAASECGRDVVYFTFEDEQLMEDLHGTHLMLVEKQLSVGELHDLLVQYYNKFVNGSNRKPRPSVFTYIHGIYNNSGGNNSDSSKSPSPTLLEQNAAETP